MHACACMAAAAVLACDSACASISTLQVMVASVALLYKWLRQQLCTAELARSNYMSICSTAVLDLYRSRW